MLGGNENFSELMCLLDFIENTDCNAVPVAWSSHNDELDTSDRSTGRRTPLAGDFIYYDPWTRVAITRDEAFILRDAERNIPERHPTGFVLTEESVQAEDAQYPMLDDVHDEDYRNAPVATKDLANQGAVPSIHVTSIPTSVTPPTSATPLAAPVPFPSTSVASFSSVMNDAQRAAVISQFLREAGLSDVASSDILQMHGALRAPVANIIVRLNRTPVVLPSEDLESC